MLKKRNRITLTRLAYRNNIYREERKLFETAGLVLFLGCIGTRKKINYFVSTAVSFLTKKHRILGKKSKLLLPKTVLAIGKKASISSKYYEVPTCMQMRWMRI